jgi:hypothetical protein
VRALALLTVLLSSVALAQAPAPPEAVQPPTAQSGPQFAEDPTGWARAGGAIGFALMAVPVGLAVAYAVTSWSWQTAPDLYLVGAGVAGPVCALLPTFAARSTVFGSDLAPKPRLFRNVGWVLVAFGTLGLLVTPLYNDVFHVRAPGPSMPDTVTAFINAGFSAAGLAFLSVAALISADRADRPPSNDANPMRLAPTVALVPGARGPSGALGLQGTF